MTNLNPTAASSWQRQTSVVLLPSGKAAEVKQIDLAGLVLSAGEGAIPDIITQQMVEEISGKTTRRGKTKKNDRNDSAELTAKDLPGLMVFVNLVTRACVVSPRIVEDGEVPNYGAGEIALEDIDLTDRMHLFSVLMPSQEMATASRFRNRSSAHVAVVSEGEDLPEDAQ